MALRYNNFTALEPLASADIQVLSDNGIVEIDSASDLSNADLVNVNQVYQLDIGKMRIRKTPGTGSTHWGNPFDSGESPATATGGTESTYTGDGTNGILGTSYKVHAFTSSGSLVVTDTGQARALVLAGGGSGGAGVPGSWAGGSGGAGGFFEQDILLPAGTYTITVGGTQTNGNGNPSSIIGTDFKVWVPGGGKGGENNGASGIGGSNGSGQLATPYGGGIYGNTGGTGSGGAGGAGNPDGSGKVSYITGTSVTYGKGGQVHGSTSASDNTGNGGMYADTYSGPFPGSSGLVVIRYVA